ncbi:MAG: NADH-quinone oxidoreductase subunit NuoF [Deltaproteobacteria bacterium]|nr:NADH-quinone oxidoreductase subunit NuoF [Deltaproteobacteria bacterium]
MDLVLTKNFDLPDAFSLPVYEGRGGYSSLKKLFSLKPDEVIEEVKKSGLRGRGGAGFSAGMKWGFIPKNSGKETYLCVNADEGEPGTFKDRALLLKDPHRLIEGTIIGSYAIGCHTAYIYIRGEFFREYKILEQALSEAKAKRYLGENILGSGYDLEIYTHRGAGGYICGEETALIESLEGKRGYPRIKPPFPAIQGLFGCPTAVNNVETVCALPYIIEKGAGAYKKMGTEKSSGTKLFSISGPVNQPGVYEVEMGFPLRKFLQEQAGGLRPGKILKGVIPGGSSMPILNAEEVEQVTLDYESMNKFGTFLGSGGVIVIDEDYCLVKALRILARFYAHESCGQCSPCREGTGWVHKILKRIEEGEGKASDLDLLLDISDNMIGQTICVLADSIAMPTKAFITKFRKEFEDHISLKKCPKTIA